MTGKLSQLVVFPSKKREYNFTSTVDVPVGTPSHVSLSPQAKVAAPEEAAEPSLQEVRERRRKDKKTRRDKEKAAAVGQTPGADATPEVARAAVPAAAAESAPSTPEVGREGTDEPHERQHKSHREKKEKRRHRRQREEEAAAAADPTAAMLSVLEAKVTAIDRELRGQAGAESAGNLIAQLNDAKVTLVGTVFASETAFRATLLSDRIDILLSRHEPKPGAAAAAAVAASASAPILVPSKAASERAATAGVSPSRSPRSWNQARGERDVAGLLAPFGTHRSSSSGVPPPQVQAASPPKP